MVSVKQSCGQLGRCKQAWKKNTRNNLRSGKTMAMLQQLLKKNQNARTMWKMSSLHAHWLQWQIVIMMRHQTRVWMIWPKQHNSCMLDMWLQESTRERPRERAKEKESPEKESTFSRPSWPWSKGRSAWRTWRAAAGAWDVAYKVTGPEIPFARWLVRRNPSPRHHRHRQGFWQPSVTVMGQSLDLMMSWSLAAKEKMQTCQPTWPTGHPCPEHEDHRHLLEDLWMIVSAWFLRVIPGSKVSDELLERHLRLGAWTLCHQDQRRSSRLGNMLEWHFMKSCTSILVTIFGERNRSHPARTLQHDGVLLANSWL